MRSSARSCDSSSATIRRASSALINDGLRSGSHLGLSKRLRSPGRSLTHDRSVNGVNLLPASGEWVYDTLPARVRNRSRQSEPVIAQPQLCAGWQEDRLQLDRHRPVAGAVSGLHHRLARRRLVRQFATDAMQCKIYPSTNYIGGTADTFVANSAWLAEPWRCSGFTQASAGLIPISHSGGSFVYGGTPSDPSVVRCIRDLKARGLRVTFYPFILMDCAWLSLARPHHGYTGADISQRGDVGGDDLPRRRGGLAVRPRRDEPHRRLFRFADRLHVPPDDPALRQPLRGGRRGRLFPDRL